MSMEFEILKHNIMSLLRTCVLSVQLIVYLLTFRPFGSVIYDVAGKYDGTSVAELRKLEKVALKQCKAGLDLTFLQNCKLFRVFPKFLSFRIPYGNSNDLCSIRKRLLRSAIHKRISEKRQLDRQYDSLVRKLKCVLSPLDWFIINRCVARNVRKSMDTVVRQHASKMRKLTHNTELPFTADNVITNISSHKLSSAEQDALKFGLKHGLPPSRLSKTDVFVSFEKLYNYLSSNLKEGANSNQLKTDLSHMAHHYVSVYKPSKQALRKHSILKKLKSNPDLVVTKPDKGNGVVIMNKSDYHTRMLEMIGDESKFKKRDRFCGIANKDITIFREGQLQRFLYSLKKKKLLDDAIYDRVYPKGSVPARIYGQPKLHKLNANDILSKQVPPFRIIVSSTGAFNYNIAKYLTEVLSPLLPTEHCAKDSFSFVDDMKQVSLNNKFLVSYDVVSLFTNIPLDETIDLAVNLIKAKDSSIKMSHAQLRKLFMFATSQTHFLYNDQYYDQVDGVAMGSPLGPVLANLFMGVHEDEWLQSYPGIGPSFYRRYVDDIFCVFDSEDQAKLFLDYLNTQHDNIKFTSEYEQDGLLAFLDVQVSRNPHGVPITTTYRKPTNTGLLTNFTSFTSFTYKIGLIRTLTDRAHKINTDAIKLANDLKFIAKVLQKNSFPMVLISKVMAEYGNNVRPPRDEVEGEEIIESRYFKLPYIGQYSVATKLKLKKLITQYCEKVEARFIFTSSKVGQYFSNKDKIPYELQSFVVYKFTCSCCGATYIGETTKHLPTRIAQHLETDTSSSVYKHLHGNNRQSRRCKRTCNADCFVILDHAETSHQLKIKEGMYIARDSPQLNKQVYSYTPNIKF